MKKFPKPPTFGYFQLAPGDTAGGDGNLYISIQEAVWRNILHDENIPLLFEDDQYWRWNAPSRIKLEETRRRYWDLPTKAESDGTETNTRDNSPRYLPKPVLREDLTNR
jgi:hypothetical protein